jgi:hypothetical protein
MCVHTVVIFSSRYETSYFFGLSSSSLARFGVIIVVVVPFPGKAINHCSKNLDEGSSFHISHEKRISLPGLPDFSWYKMPKRENIYQVTMNYTKCR